MKKFLGIFMLTAVFLILTCANAFAIERTKNVQIQFNDIKLIIDGVPVVLKDVNGSDIEPFIYNGTTYLPLRAISEAVGKEVTWDGTTKTIYLGKVSNKSEDDSEDLSGKMFKYMSGEFLSKFSINEVNGKKSGELMFWHDFGDSPSDEEFFF